MGGGKTDALDARHIVHVPQQVREGPLPAPRAVGGHARQIAPVGVYILAQQGHLLVPRLPQYRHFVLRLETVGWLLGII